MHDLTQPLWPVLITNGSTPRSRGVNPLSDLNSVFLYPQHFHIAQLPNTPTSLENFAETYLKDPGKENPVDFQDRRHHSPEERFDGTGFPFPEKLTYQFKSSVTILICGHMSRDTRCGILGPILQQEFNDFIAKDVRPRRRQARNVTATSHKVGNPPARGPLENATVGLTSHIGGHAFAGNVVIYLPPNWRAEDGKSLSPLAGRGIWYGRVEPRHVWGIMEETVKKGRIIEELLRGVHDPQLWLANTKREFAIPPTKLDKKDVNLNF